MYSIYTSWSQCSVSLTKRLSSSKRTAGLDSISFLTMLKSCCMIIGKPTKESVPGDTASIPPQYSVILRCTQCNAMHLYTSMCVNGDALIDICYGHHHEGILTTLALDTCNYSVFIIITVIMNLISVPTLRDGCIYS